MVTMETPKSEIFDDIYFSIHDGLAETHHVYMGGNNYPARWRNAHYHSICELGFGTGLNFLATAHSFLESADETAILDYIAIEKYPLDARFIKEALAIFSDRLDAVLCDEFYNSYPPAVPGFHRLVLCGRIRLTLVFEDVLWALPQIVAPRGIGAWYLDGFAPSKNPDMWVDEIYHHMARLSCRGASVATFTAAGVVKRGLAQAGFTVTKQKGYGYKRDMLTAFLDQDAAAQIIEQASERHYHAEIKEKSSYKIAILGAGMAGAAASYFLRKDGHNVTIYDTADEIASGASGNVLGLCNPRLAASRSAVNEYFASSYVLAMQLFPKLSADFDNVGILHYMQTPSRHEKMNKCKNNWGWPDSEMRLVDAKEASLIAGIDLSHEALYLPRTGSINPAKLVKSYIGDGIVNLSSPCQYEAVGDQWRVDGILYDKIIFAAGEGLLSILGGPLERVKGQITIFDVAGLSGDILKNLKCYIGYGGYVTRYLDEGRLSAGRFVTGATFGRHDTNREALDADDDVNLGELFEALGSRDDGSGEVHKLNRDDFAIVDHRAAHRCATNDRVPVVGAIGQGQYVTGAHGSYGILSCLLAGQYLADEMGGYISCLPADTMKQIDPKRFQKVKRIKRNRARKWLDKEGAEVNAPESPIS
jgi:tRNA 5-methylaminomethyl-2-thiouridine biosynthesis bifunctional protein